MIEEEKDEDVGGKDQEKVPRAPKSPDELDLEKDQLVTVAKENKDYCTLEQSFS